MSNLADLRNLYLNSEITLRTKFGWSNQDARIGVFGKCLNVIEVSLFSLDFEKTKFNTMEYRKEFSKNPPSDEELLIFNESYLGFFLLSYAVLFISQIEGTFRILVKALDSTACKNGTANFQSIYGWLLKNLGLRRYGILLELMRLIRNCMQNNGIFNPEDGGDIKINYKTKKFEFKVGQQIHFVTFDLLVLLSHDLHDMLVDVVCAKKLSSISFIDEPAFPK